MKLKFDISSDNILSLDANDKELKQVAKIVKCVMCNLKGLVK
jgi:hypothetical protein